MQEIKENNLEEIITALKNGAVLILPTDTVYGLVCDATNTKAVRKIFEIKRRDISKPLAVFVKDIKMAEKYAEINEEQKNILFKAWPGATTFVLKSKLGLSNLIYKEGTVALRIPDYNLIKDIFSSFSVPLAQTSANISGLPPTNKINEVFGQFEGKDVVVVNVGDLPNNKPSTIIDLTENKILRK